MELLPDQYGISLNQEAPLAGYASMTEINFPYQDFPASNDDFINDPVSYNPDRVYAVDYYSTNYIKIPLFIYRYLRG